MALQIANPIVVGKVERLAKASGLSKTAAVEKAVDQLLSETVTPKGNTDRRLAALIEQLDRIADLPDAFEPLQWDEQGLPR